MCHEPKIFNCILHASILCQSEICVGWLNFWATDLAFAVAVFAVFAVFAAIDGNMLGISTTGVCKKYVPAGSTNLVPVYIRATSQCIWILGLDAD